MCNPNCTIGTGGDFTTVDAWVDAMSSFACDVYGYCIDSGYPLGYFSPPAVSNVTRWSLLPNESTDRHDGRFSGDAYDYTQRGASLWSIYAGAMSVPVSVLGLRVYGNVMVQNYPDDLTWGDFTFDSCLGHAYWLFDNHYNGLVAFTVQNNILLGQPDGPFLCVSATAWGANVNATIQNNTIIGRGYPYDPGWPHGMFQLSATPWGTLNAFIYNNVVMDIADDPGPVFWIDDTHGGYGPGITIAADSNTDNDAGVSGMPGSNRRYSPAAVEFLDGGIGLDARLGPLASSRCTGTDNLGVDALGLNRPQEAGGWSRGALEYTWNPEVTTMGVKLGYDGKLYYCAAGIGGTPAWTLINNVRDVTGPGERNEVDVTTRGSGGWKLAVGGLLEGPIEFEMVYDTADAAMIAIQTAFTTNAPIGMAWMNGPVATSGSYGLWADMAVLKFQREEALDGAMVVKVAVKPTLTANPPHWKTIGS